MFKLRLLQITALLRETVANTHASRLIAIQSYVPGVTKWIGTVEREAILDPEPNRARWCLLGLEIWDNPMRGPRTICRIGS